MKSSEKLYLVRRNLRHFVGPKTLQGIKQSFATMQITAEDEIAGHCGQWVSLSKSKDLATIYPEILKAIESKAVAPDIVTDNIEDTAKVVRFTRTMEGEVDHRQGRWKWLAIAILLLLVLGGTGYLHYRGYLFGLIPGGRDVSTVAQVAEDPEKFNAAMERVLRGNSGFSGNLTEWLPYLRRYAFSKEGAIKGVTSESLLGISPGLPEDCSLKFMKKAFASKNRDAFELLTKGKSSRLTAIRLVTWDPYWIKRRPMTGWKDPSGPYSACLAMARKALAAESILKKEVLIYEVDFRFAYLQGVLNGDSDKRLTATDFWTCCDRSGSLSELVECRERFAATMNDSVANRYMTQRLAWSLARIYFENRGIISEEGVVQLRDWLSILENDQIDSATLFDYRAEYRFLSLLLKDSQEWSVAASRVKVEYPEVIFSRAATGDAESP